MNWRQRFVLLAILAVVAMVCGLPLIAAVTDPPPVAPCGIPGGGSTTSATSSAMVHGGQIQAIGRWSTTQVANAATIVAVGRGMNVSPRGWVIAVATAMQESGLTNSSRATDHDSVGLFQQRPSQGWGTVAQITDPVYASRKFYAKLLGVAHWKTLPLSQAAQAVQRSAFPDAYAKWEDDAQQVVTAVAGVKSIDGLPGGALVDCGEPAGVSSGGWTQPVRAPIVSGFRTPERPTHQGVDLAAARNTVIRAAAAGRVVWAGCDPATGNCDIDGSLQTPGCGWYVEIQHLNGAATRYCHMISKPFVVFGQTVDAGDPIGAVGASGHVTGPHLHYEVHTDVGCDDKRCSLTNANAIDPVPWMEQMGAPLGTRVS